MIHRAIYRKAKDWVRDLTACTVHLENGDEIGLNRRQKIMLRALRQWATKRQRECLYLYYGRGLSQQEIAKLLGVNLGTISRNIKAGERHVTKALEVADTEEKVRCEK